MNFPENNILDQWLSKYGNKEIESIVEKQAHEMYIETIDKIKVRQYCKRFKIKFGKWHENGFIGSYRKPIFAGLQYDYIAHNYVSIPIKKIGYKRIFEQFECHRDGDITSNGIIN